MSFQHTSRPAYIAAHISIATLYHALLLSSPFKSPFLYLIYSCPSFTPCSPLLASFRFHLTLTSLPLASRHILLHPSRLRSFYTSQSTPFLFLFQICLCYVNFQLLSHLVQLLTLPSSLFTRLPPLLCFFLVYFFTVFQHWFPMPHEFPAPTSLCRAYNLPFLVPHPVPYPATPLTVPNSSLQQQGPSGRCAKVNSQLPSPLGKLAACPSNSLLY